MTLLDQIAGAHERVLRPSGGCHNCPRKRIDFVPSTLTNGPVLFLGEAPGATEVEKQVGFTGQSGELLRTHAEEFGVPEPWSFSNTIHCRPPKNATPKSKEIQCCLSQFVLDEIRGYPIVALVGAIPLQAIFPGVRATHFRGNFAHHPDFPGQRFYAMYHPAYMLRRPDLLDMFKRQMARLARVAIGEPPQPWTTLRGTEAYNALADMVREPVLSFDGEMTGVESWDVANRWRGFCATADGKTVAAFHEDDPVYLAALELIHEFLRNPSKSMIGAHVSHDMEWLERDGGYRVAAGVHDVTVIWYEAGQYQQASLKQLAAERLDGYRYLVDRPDKIADVDLLMRYNAEDVVYPFQLFRKGMLALKPKTRDLVTRVIGPMSLVYQRARCHGLYIREDYRRQLSDDYMDRRRAAVDAWAAADPDFIPTKHESGNGLAEYLFKIKKLTPVARTESGVPSMDKSSVKQWVRDGATQLEHLLTIREIDKLHSTFIKPLEKHIDAASRIHPTHWLTSTDTSRPSSSNPNVYNIARKPEIRDIYGVPPGHLLLESDLSQIEFRIMVCRARDENGIAGYRRGDDAHTMTARTLTGSNTPTKEHRTLAKPVNFALLYGGDWGVVQRTAWDDYGLDWDETQCRDFTDGFFATYPGIPKFHNWSRDELIRNRGWFESVTGHVYHYADWDAGDWGRRDHAFRAALNSEAQGPAANICYYIAVLAQRLLFERHFDSVVMVNSVYDSLMTEIPNPDWAEPVVNTINDAVDMAANWVKDWFVVPLVIEHAIGESWGSLKPWTA